MTPTCVPSLETAKRLVRSLTKFRIFSNVPCPFLSMLPDPSIMKARSAFALHSTKRERKYDFDVCLRHKSLGCCRKRGLLVVSVFERFFSAHLS